MITLTWRFDKPYYSPSEIANIDFWLQNNGATYISISQISVEFEFGICKLAETICGMIPPLNSGSPNIGYLGTARVLLPSHRVGSQRFSFKYILHEWINQKWLPHPMLRSEQFIINVYSTPVYPVFLSRGIRFEDRIIGDQIAQIIREWGCDPVTVGINIHVPEHQVAAEIESQIQDSRGLIAIATPRIFEHSTLEWYTFEWLQSEAALAYAKRKPILILKDRTVTLGGLPSYLHPETQLEFDAMNLGDLKTKLSVIMPRFRRAIEQRATQEFYQSLADLAIRGLAAFGGIILIGIIGSFIDDK
jgi:hypothetical protein